MGIQTGGPGYDQRRMQKLPGTKRNIPMQPKEIAGIHIPRMLKKWINGLF
jgi:hypothetical protein